MKKLLLLLSLSLLAGCVTYYDPVTAIEDGVYYAEPDPVYTNSPYVNYSYGYPGAAYYPWWSMDYFYLGYFPRAGFGYRHSDYGYGSWGYDRWGYGGWGGGGFSIGISSGYSPWYYPYYSYYSPWHHPYYRHPWGRKRHGNHGGGDHDRYVGNDHTYRGSRGGEDEDGNEDPAGRRSGNHTGSDRTSPVRRYVSTAPSGYSGNQGMVIRSRETTKIGKSRLEPVQAKPLKATPPTASSPRVAQPDYRSRQVGSEIRYRSAAKQGRSRTGPVDYRPAAKGTAVATAPVRTHYRSRQGGGEIRYRSGAKQGKSRTDPVGSTSLPRGISSATVSSPTLVVPAQSSGNRHSAQRKATRQASGRLPSGTRSSPSTRPTTKVSGSSSSRSHSTSSGSSPVNSSRSSSERSRSHR